jgi:hypothetical protein
LTNYYKDYRVKYPRIAFRMLLEVLLRRRNVEITDMKGAGNCSYKITGIEGDMGEEVRMGLLLQADGDVVVTLQKVEGRLVLPGLSIEFCSVGSGGGRNPEIVKGLREIIQRLVDKEKREGGSTRK